VGHRQTDGPLDERMDRRGVQMWSFLITKENLKLAYILLGGTELFTAVRVPV
jgi:hypothetical protein